MTRGQILRMAEEAGFFVGESWRDAPIVRFAALIAAAEREKTAQIVEELSNKALHAQLQAVAAEREACAQLCEDHFMSDGDWCAKQIRAKVQE